MPCGNGNQALQCQSPFHKDPKIQHGKGCMDCEGTKCQGIFGWHQLGLWWCHCTTIPWLKQPNFGILLQEIWNWAGIQMVQPWDCCARIP